MHLMYRSKKHSLPIVNLQEPKLSPYYNQLHTSPQNSLFSKKKSIDVIL